MAKEPKYTGPSKELMNAMMQYYMSRIGKPKDMYTGQLRAGQSPAQGMAQAMMMQRYGSGGPQSWNTTRGFLSKYGNGTPRGGGGGGQMPSGGGGMQGMDPRMLQALMAQMGGGGRGQGGQGGLGGYGGY